MLVLSKSCQCIQGITVWVQSALLNSSTNKSLRCQLGLQSCWISNQIKHLGDVLTTKANPTLLIYRTPSAYSSANIWLPQHTFTSLVHDFMGQGCFDSKIGADTKYKYQCSSQGICWLRPNFCVWYQTYLLNSFSISVF